MPEYMKTGILSLTWKNKSTCTYSGIECDFLRFCWFENFKQLCKFSIQYFFLEKDLYQIKRWKNENGPILHSLQPEWWCKYSFADVLRMNIISQVTFSNPGDH